jgi:hypothetical protein
MTKERRFFSPITASIAAGAMVAAATLGGTLASDESAKERKADRFEVMGDNLCEGQTWPNLSPECLAWAEGETTEGNVRFVTVVETDETARVTKLTRMPAEAGN